MFKWCKGLNWLLYIPHPTLLLLNRLFYIAVNDIKSNSSDMLLYISVFLNLIQVHMSCAEIKAPNQPVQMNSLTRELLCLQISEVNNTLQIS